jgi:hypothetical protein
VQQLLETTSQDLMASQTDGEDWCTASWSWPRRSAEQQPTHFSFSEAFLKVKNIFALVAILLLAIGIGFFPVILLASLMHTDNHKCIMDLELAKLTALFIFGLMIPRCCGSLVKNLTSSVRVSAVSMHVIAFFSAPLQSLAGPVEDTISAAVSSSDTGIGGAAVVAVVAGVGIGAVAASVTSDNESQSDERPRRAKHSKKPINQNIHLRGANGEFLIT